MHPEAYDGFGRMLAASGLNRDLPWRILDVGGADANGTVHAYFPNATITTLDLYGADIIADATTYEPDPVWDAVISTEMFEHVEKWPTVLAMMLRAIGPAGPGVVLFTCASTNRRPHGATGALDPAPEEWYQNVGPGDVRQILAEHCSDFEVEYQYPPGDLYGWGRIAR